MRQQIVIFACLCSALVYALPVSDTNNKDGLQLVQIPLGDNKELDILSVDEDGRLSERSKRTIGILRELFPELTKQVEEQINGLIGQLIRTLGPTVLRTAIQGGNANRARSDFDADFDDDDDDEDSGSRVQIELPSFDPSEDEDLKNTNDNLNNGDNTIDLNALNEQLQETIRVARQAASENSVTNDASGDQDAAESKSPALDELTLDADDADGDDRNKRFLNFGFGASGQGQASGGGGSGGSGGAGSGNFLFDIIRRTADRAARAAGTVYRVVAGTETLDLNDTGSQKFTTTTKTHQPGHFSKYFDRTARTINDGLFSGSVQTPQGDERANEPAQSTDDSNQGGGGAANDGYTEGIPGPVTRFVVLANRGLANLIQDLILRIAATSERLVNFKARLITSLI